MNKTAAIGAVLAATTNEPVVFTTGYACRIARHLGDRPGHFYMTGSMGLACAIGAGVALETGRTTVIVDGDGSVLMNPACLVTAGAMTSLPLVHVLLDDGRYASTGGQEVPSARADLCAWALASGYLLAADTAGEAELTELLRTELAAGNGPVFLRCVLTEPDPPVPPRVDVDLPTHARRFTAHCGE
ncbi:thiamine pyrophosphate-dependent enzyme [Amycolatopsis cihanbeyliensis]|uniref:Sulfopyruvate decarboxylase subunit beta n=1 Tax=Amycolatopsis cihanbeyliensis TaxID=1128664 RepID=A0A542DFG5_AMYCI|nr:thiamine pyrophosphate-dependent enzyme [Amycolatopsis cihanbeyliensis]TQJ01813.1 sulfopyruvate decarboxylase subunit beta [Amycolatopsis cihanbeyliensis]